MSERERVSRTGGARRRGADTELKTKKPTRQCGEKQEFSYIDGLHNFVSWI